jgi:hypothetical protein
MTRTSKIYKAGRRRALGVFGLSRENLERIDLGAYVLKKEQFAGTTNRWFWFWFGIGPNDPHCSDVWPKVMEILRSRKEISIDLHNLWIERIEGPTEQDFRTKLPGRRCGFAIARLLELV